MEQTREEILENIEKLLTAERAVRRELAALDEQSKKLSTMMNSCIQKIAAYEKERFSLESSLIAIKKCKPYKSGRSKNQPSKANILKACSSMSTEERKALIALLSSI